MRSIGRCVRSLSVVGDGDALVLDDIGLTLDVATLYSDLPPVTDADRPRLPRPLADGG